MNALRAIDDPKGGPNKSNALNPKQVIFFNGSMVKDAERVAEGVNQWVGQAGAKASLVTSMGRMACHTGKLITFEDMLNCEHEFAPGVDQLSR